MKILSKALAGIGGAFCCVSFCLSGGYIWWLPCVMLLLGMALILCSIRLAYCKPEKKTRREPEYITVTDESGNEVKLIPPITDFDLVYLSAIRKEFNNYGFSGEF